MERPPWLSLIVEDGLSGELARTLERMEVESAPFYAEGMVRAVAGE